MKYSNSRILTKIKGLGDIFLFVSNLKIHPFTYDFESQNEDML